MKKLSTKTSLLIALLATISGFILLVISCFIICGCSNKTTVTKDSGTAVTKDEEIIKPVSLRSHNPIYTNIFLDTETGHEYIVFTYNGRIAATPRLPKEDDSSAKGYVN